MISTFIDVFDPGRARAGRDLKELSDMTDVAPSPDGHDRPVVVDLPSGTAHVRQPR
jgi:hypothetical protein